MPHSLATLADKLNSKTRGNRRLPSLLLLTDARRLPDPGKAIRRLPKGAAVIFRDYDAPHRAALAARLRALCRRRGVLFLVAGDGALALSVSADGLHLPARAFTDGPLWRRRKPGWLITAACHGRAGLRRAKLAGAGAALLSPVFPTASHPGAPPLGALHFRIIARAAPLPVYALGGVTARRALSLKGSGAAGIAAIGAFGPR